MEVFNIIVGIATIISGICAIISIRILNSMWSQIKNTGNDNVNNINIQKNNGINNQNEITNNLSLK